MSAGSIYTVKIKNGKISITTDAHTGGATCASAKDEEFIKKIMEAIGADVVDEGKTAEAFAKRHVGGSFAEEEDEISEKKQKMTLGYGE